MQKEININSTVLIKKNINNGRQKSLFFKNSFFHFTIDEMKKLQQVFFFLSEVLHLSLLFLVVDTDAVWKSLVADVVVAEMITAVVSF